MIFSLDELMVTFGRDVKRPENIVLIKKDLMHIRNIYRKERGLLKSLKMTDRHILELFQFHVPGICTQNNDVFSSWKEFVNDCEVGGADFLES